MIAVVGMVLVLVIAVVIGIVIVCISTILCAMMIAKAIAIIVIFVLIAVDIIAINISINTVVLIYIVIIIVAVTHTSNGTNDGLIVLKAFITAKGKHTIVVSSRREILHDFIKKLHRGGGQTYHACHQQTQQRGPNIVVSVTLTCGAKQGSRHHPNSMGARSMASRFL